MVSVLMALIAPNVEAMFGPLNGVRTALVIAAAVAALAALIAGYVTAAVVLLAGVGVHGLGWLYLYRRRQEGPAAPPRHG